MRFTPTSLLLLASGALAASSQHECIVDNASHLAQLAGCGSLDDIRLCLGGISSASAQDLNACFVDAGCSESEAAFAAGRVVGHCENDDLDDEAELRKRYRGIIDDAAAAMARTAPADVARTVFARQETGTTECYTSSEVQTTACPTSTGDDGSTTTGDCTDTVETQSSCLPGKTCSVDGEGNDICMTLNNDPGVAGIVISIVFGVAIFAGIATLVWMSIRDRREQRRLAAKSEAVALARAQTKKMRAKEGRQALLQKQNPAAAAGPGAAPAPGAGDPFADRNRS